MPNNNTQSKELTDMEKIEYLNAIDELTKQIALSGKKVNADAYFLRAQAYYALGEENEARADALRAMRVGDKEEYEELFRKITKLAKPQGLEKPLTVKLRSGSPNADIISKPIKRVTFDLPAESVMHSKYILEKGYAVSNSKEGSYARVSVSDKKENDVIFYTDKHAACEKPIDKSIELIASRFKEIAQTGDVVVIEQGKDADKIALAKACEKLKLKVAILDCGRELSLEEFQARGPVGKASLPKVPPAPKDAMTSNSCSQTAIKAPVEEAKSTASKRM